MGLAHPTIHPYGVYSTADQVGTLGPRNSTPLFCGRREYLHGERLSMLFLLIIVSTTDSSDAVLCRHVQARPVLISIQNEREFAALCTTVLLQPNLPNDPRFASNVDRVQNEAAWDGVMRTVFCSTPRVELIGRLQLAGIAYAEVRDCAGLSNHPALCRIEVKLPDGTTVSHPAPPATIDGKYREFGPVPAVGSHSDSIRGEFL